MSVTAALFLCMSPVVVDGDTIRCRDVGRVRLLSIDAPDLPGHCRVGRECVSGDGFASKRYLASLMAGWQVTCSPRGNDRYGRVLALCVAHGADLSCAMVAAGQAAVRYGRLDCR